MSDSDSEEEEDARRRRRRVAEPPASSSSSGRRGGGAAKTKATTRRGDASSSEEDARPQGGGRGGVRVVSRPVARRDDDSSSSSSSEGAPRRPRGGQARDDDSSDDEGVRETKRAEPPARDPPSDDDSRDAPAPALAPAAGRGGRMISDDSDSESNTTETTKNKGAASSLLPVVADRGGKKDGGKSVRLQTMLDAKIAEIGPMRALYRMKKAAATHGPKPESANVPEVHFIGEIVDAANFPNAQHGLVCAWYVQWEEPWVLLEGDTHGQTQTATARQGSEGVPWNHPVDLHFAARSALGWPKVVLQVHSLDAHGRSNLAGYGFAHLPSAPGAATVEVACWRPTGSMRDEVASFFLGNTPQLTNNDVICTKAAWTSRCRLVTVPAGTVRLSLNVMLRHFQDQHVDGLRT